MTALQDIRFGARVLGRSPGFAAVAIATLALGIGANVAVFSVMHAVLWRALPYPDADRLVVLRVDARGVVNAGASPAELRDLSERARLLGSLAAINGVDAHVNVDGVYERVAAASATDGVLPLLGAVPLAHGRTLRAADDIGAQFVRSVVISDALWRRSFAADPAAVGRRVQVNNLDVEIVGILRPGFRVFLPPDTLAAEEIDVWFANGTSGGRDQRGLPIVGRLQPGATLAQAQAELDALSAQFVAEHPGAYPGGALRMTIRPLSDALTADVRPALFALAGAVAFVLLIACVNVANLMVARGKARERELAVRRALGASRGRLVSQMLAESLLLAGAGAAVGLLLAYVGVDLVEWLRPAHLPRQSQIALDRTAVLFAVAASAALAVVLGVLPALKFCGARAPAATGFGRGDTGAPATRRLQRGLVVLEVALSIVPLVAAGLMLRTFVNLTQAPIGFNPAGVLTARVPITFRKFPEPAQRWALFRELLDQVRRMPGVEAVSGAGPLPFGPWQITRRYGAAGDPSAPMALATQQSTLPGYLALVGTPLLEGRDFTEEDFTSRRAVAIVDERIARQLWPGRPAVGNQLAIQVGRSATTLEVIGVTSAVRVTRVRDEGLPHFFVPYHLYATDMTLVIRTRESAEAIGPALGRLAAGLGTGRAVFDVRPMEDYVARSIGDTRFTLLVLLGFAAASLLLAGVGVYGTLAYLISQRTRELGIRVALGAAPSRLVGMVVGEGAVLAAAGAVIGLASAMAATNVLRGLLYQVAPFDAVTLLFVCGLMALVAMAASAPPAWRAARIDPTVALRAD